MASALLFAANGRPRIEAVRRPEATLVIRMNDSSRESGMYDFFISYKHKDAKDFAATLTDGLRTSGAEVWLDQLEMRPGDSILSGIEDGIKSSIDAVVILTQNYFSGWSDAERRNLYSLMVSKKLRIIPIWLELTHEEIEMLAPMFVDIVAVQVQKASEPEARRVAREILERYNPKQRENRLYELFFQGIRKHIDDPDLDLFLGVYRSDLRQVKTAVEAGANVAITDGELWNRYAKVAITHKDLFSVWRKLFLHLTAAGKINRGHQSDV